LRSFILVTVLSSASFVAGAQTDSTARKSNDPRVGLGGGWMDAKEAASNLQLTWPRCCA
jgi:hypothetical protein